MTYRKLANTNDLTHEQWLSLRQNGIGGSDASAILGLSPYKTAYEVFLDKTGLLPPNDDNEAMRQGRDLESYVVQRFTEHTGKKTRKLNYLLQSTQHEFMFANVDGLIVGENAGLECKTTSVLNLRRFKDGDFPAEYYCQCVHYMAVMGAERWYLAVLILNQGFKVYQLTTHENDHAPDWCESSIHVAPDEMSTLIDAERTFWHDHVITGTPPEPLGGTNESESLLRTFPHADNETSVLLYHRAKEIQQLVSIKAEIHSLETEKKRLENILKSELKDSEIGVSHDYMLRWSNCSRTNFDSSKLSKEHPEIYRKYTVKKEFRRFTIEEVI